MIDSYRPQDSFLSSTPGIWLCCSCTMSSSTASIPQILAAEDSCQTAERVGTGNTGLTMFQLFPAI